MRAQNYLKRLEALPSPSEAMQDYIERTRERIEKKTLGAAAQASAAFTKLTSAERDTIAAISRDLDV